MFLYFAVFIALMLGFNMYNYNADYYEFTVRVWIILETVISFASVIVHLASYWNFIENNHEFYAHRLAALSTITLLEAFVSITGIVVFWTAYANEPLVANMRTA